MTERTERVDLVKVPPGGTVLPGPWPTLDTPADAIEGEVVGADLAVRPRGDVDIPPARATAARTVAFRVVQGHGLAARRALDAATHAAIREQVRGALAVQRATGDDTALMEWQDRLARAKRERLDRVLGMPAVLRSAAVSTLVTAVAIVGVLLAVGVAVGVVSPFGYGWGDYWWTLGRLAWLLTHALVVVVPLAGLGAVRTWLLYTYRLGHVEGATPTWMATSGDIDIDIEIDERTITLALAAMRIPKITAYLKTGAPLQYLTPVRQEGRGTYTEIRLPRAVPAELFAKPQRRAELASGLHRRPNEVWPRMGSEAGILALWIADKGALAEGAGPYPLLEAGTVDVFRGVPFGKSLRGEPLVCQLRGRNTIVGGMPDQGKSSVARIVMVGAALDHTAELRIWVPDNNFDFEAFRPRCSRYVMGAEDEHVEQIVLDLEELVAEIQVRGRKLIEHGEPEVTRKLADADVGMHPVVALLEEAHLVFGHPEFGKRAGKAAGTIVRLGRKRFIHLIVSTQATTGQSVPQEVTTNSANGVAFAVARWQENDALLGQGAYTAGHRATDLIPGVDKGNAVVRGLTGDRSTVAQAHFLSVSRGNDQVGPVVRRSLDVIARHRHAVPGTDRPRRDAAVEERDLLEDLDQALGVEKVTAADAAALLRDHAPDWAPYQGLTGGALVRLLADEGVKVPSTNNRWLVDPLTVREEIGRRSTADLDE